MQFAPRAEPERPKKGLEFPERSASKLLEAYRPAYLAIGGEHVVYTVPEAEIPNPAGLKSKSGEGERKFKREIVFKAATQPMREIVEDNLAAGRPPDELTSEEREKKLQEIALLNRKFAKFKKFFGAEHVVDQKFFLMKVPLRDSDVTETILGADAPDIESAWTLVTVQRKVPEIQDRKAESFNGYYLEAEVEIDDDIYSALTEHLLKGKDLSPGMADQLMSFQFPRIKEWEQLIRNPRRRAELEDFVSQAIAYTKGTGEILDLFGTDNLIFYDKLDEDKKRVTEYKLVDAFYPNEREPGKLSLAKTLLKQLTLGNARYEADIDPIVGAINYVRIINLWAAKLGLPDRLTWDTPFSPKVLARVGKLASERFQKAYPDYKLHDWDEAKTVPAKYAA